MELHRSPQRLVRSFFERDVLSCARDLIGCELFWNGVAGIVVETEAYAVKGDEACHAFSRQGTRDFVEKHPAGTAYVYLNYGIHWLLNVLVKGCAQDGLILFRAIEPTRGVEAMQARRNLIEPVRLCSGPGKLGQALGVTGADHVRDLGGDGGRGFRARRQEVEVETDVRIGISRAAELPWRFLLKESPWVSVKPTGNRNRGRRRPVPQS